MVDIDQEEKETDLSISGRPAAQFVTQDSSLAGLLLHHNIKVRDLILLSILSEQGPTRIKQLARHVNIAPEILLESVKRLATEGLLSRNPMDTTAGNDSLATLTRRGEDIAGRVRDQPG
jgi:DNA-binding HxlR family transcriptional regulator